MDQEQLINDLRARLTASHDLRIACQIIGERFRQWPVLRRDLAEAVSSVFGEENSDVRKETPKLVDRLIREGILMAHPGGAYLRCAVPIGEILNLRREAPPTRVFTFRPEVPEAPAPTAQPAADDAEEEEDAAVGLSLEEAVLIGLYAVHLERHHGLFACGTVVADLQRLFRDWHLPTQLHGAKGIWRVIVRYLQEEILEIADEGGETYQLTERGLQDAKTAKSDWDARH